MTVLYKLIKIKTICNTLSINDTISTNIIYINFISRCTNEIVMHAKKRVMFILSTTTMIATKIMSTDELRLTRQTFMEINIKKTLTVY